MNELINTLATNGTGVTLQNKMKQTMLEEVEIAPTMIPKENNLDTMTTTISMVNTEIMLNEITISTFTSETIAAEILTSTPMFLEEILVAIDNSTSNNLNRRKRAFEPDEDIRIDKIGKP